MIAKLFTGTKEQVENGLISFFEDGEMVYNGKNYERKRQLINSSLAKIDGADYAVLVVYHEFRGRKK